MGWGRKGWGGGVAAGGRSALGIGRAPALAPAFGQSSCSHARPGSERRPLAGGPVFPVPLVSPPLAAIGRAPLASFPRSIQVGTARPSPGPARGPGSPPRAGVASSAAARGGAEPATPPRSPGPPFRESGPPWSRGSVPTWPRPGPQLRLQRARGRESGSAPRGPGGGGDILGR